ncbi:hypothetical protein D3C87_1736810 [compost metagenome]
MLQKEIKSFWQLHICTAYQHCFWYACKIIARKIVCFVYVILKPEPAERIGIAELQPSDQSGVICPYNPK